RGKMNSRANRLGVGLRSKVVFTVDMAAAILDRAAAITAQLQPRSTLERICIVDMSVAKAKEDIGNELLGKDVDRRIDRSLDQWDDERRAAALDLATRLDRDPVRTKHGLGRTKQGVQVIVEMWKGLAYVVESGHDWDDAQYLLACNLMGIRPELRAINELIPK